MGLWAPTEATNAIYWLGSFLRIENLFLAKLHKLHMGRLPRLWTPNYCNNDTLH